MGKKARQLLTSYSLTIPTSLLHSVQEGFQKGARMGPLIPVIFIFLLSRVEGNSSNNNQEYFEDSNNSFDNNGVGGVRREESLSMQDFLATGGRIGALDLLDISPVKPIIASNLIVPVEEENKGQSGVDYGPFVYAQNHPYHQLQGQLLNLNGDVPLGAVNPNVDYHQEQIQSNPQHVHQKRKKKKSRRRHHSHKLQQKFVAQNEEEIENNEPIPHELPFKHFQQKKQQKTIQNFHKQVPIPQNEQNVQQQILPQVQQQQIPQNNKRARKRKLQQLSQVQNNEIENEEQYSQPQPQESRYVKNYAQPIQRQRNNYQNNLWNQQQSFRQLQVPLNSGYFNQDQQEPRQNQFPQQTQQNPNFIQANQNQFHHQNHFPQQIQNFQSHQNQFPQNQQYHHQESRQVPHYHPRPRNYPPRPQRQRPQHFQRQYNSPRHLRHHQSNNNNIPPQFPYSPPRISNQPNNNNAPAFSANNQYQNLLSPIPNQFQGFNSQMEPMQPAMSMSVARIGRTGRNSYSTLRSRATYDEDDDDGYHYTKTKSSYGPPEDHHEYEEVPMPEKRKKKKVSKGNKGWASEADEDEVPAPEKKKEDEESFPKRIYKKTKNAIVTTTKAVFGAPKYIYTSYKRVYDKFGSSSPKKRTSKGHSSKYGAELKNRDEKAWRPQEVEEYEDDGWGWGWDEQARSDHLNSDSDYYKRKGYGQRLRRRMNKLNRRMLGADEQLMSLPSSPSWAQQHQFGL